MHRAQINRPLLNRPLLDKHRVRFAVPALLVVAITVSACTGGGSSDRSTVTSTATSTATVTETVSSTTSTPEATTPTSTPSVGPGTTLGADKDEMHYGTADINPLKPCSVLDSDAGGLVKLPLKPDQYTPNACEAFANGKGFSVTVSIGDMGGAIGKVRRCASATDKQDQCDLPAIIDDYDARTYDVGGVTVITEDIINADGGDLTANVAVSKSAWAKIVVFFEGKPTTETTRIRDTLIKQVVAHSK